MSNFHWRAVASPQTRFHVPLRLCDVARAPETLEMETCDGNEGHLERVYSHGLGTDVYFDTLPNQNRFPDLSSYNFPKDGFPEMDPDVMLDLPPKSDPPGPIKTPQPQPASEHDDKSKKKPDVPEYIAPPGFPPLHDQVIEVNRLNLAQPQGTLIKEGRRYKIFQRDLITLEGTERVSDEIVNFYLDLVKERSETEEGLPSVYAFVATFYSLLASKEGLQKVAEASEGQNIFGHELIMIPICINQHWRLAVVHVPSKTVNMYNSYSSFRDLLICKNLVRYFVKEEERLRGGDGTGLEASMGDDTDEETEEPEHYIYEDKGWKVLRPKVPQQENGHDCGVFTLLYADCVSRKIKFEFEQIHIPYVRQKLMYECITASLVD